MTATLRAATFVFMSVLWMTESRSDISRLVCRDTPFDIVFVLDSSSSIWPPDFTKQLYFVKDVVDDFKVGLSKVRVGLVTFSDYNHVALYLDESVNGGRVKNAASSVRHLTGGTKTADAIGLLTDKMFLPENGGRPHVEHLAILLTDGNSENSVATAGEALRARNAGIKIFAIGVGDKVKYSELRKITGNAERAFRAPSYSALNNIKHEVSRQTCVEVKPGTTNVDIPIPSTAPTTLSTPELSTEKQKDQNIKEDCINKKVDIFFLLDTSSSIRKDDFTKQLNFVKDMVNGFDIGRQKTRVGLATFSHNYFGIFDFSDFDVDKRRILAAIDQVQYQGGGTKTGNALQKMRLAGFSRSMLRRSAQRIAIVFTDGQSSDQEIVKTEAQLLDDAGVRTFAVGIGAFIDVEELRDIASKPAEKFVFRVESFDALLTKTGIITKETCTVTEVKPGYEEVCTKTESTDLVFMVDHILFGKERSTKIFNAIAEIIRRVSLQTSAFRIGMVYAPCTQSQDISITDHVHEATLITRINAFEHGNLSRLLRKLRLESFRNEKVKRRRVGVLFLDGSVEQSDELMAEVRRTNFRNIELYVVALGRNVNLDLARQLATKTTHLIHIRDYEQLLKLLPTKFIPKVCETEGVQVLPS